MLRSTFLITAMASIAAITLVGCAHNSDESATSSENSTPNSIASSKNPTLTRPTLTTSKLQPPPQHNANTSPGRPDVVFDPCTWISDDTIRKSGFEPSTRKRGQDQIAEPTFLTCDFKSEPSLAEYTLMVDSGNATWEEDLTKVHDYSQPLTINGREAMWVRDPNLKSDCQIDLRTKAGFVQVVVSSHSNDNAERPCGNLENIASNIETEIGKDN